jgi:hypothetical protein
VFEWQAERDLVVARALHVAAEADDLRAGVLAEAEAAVPRGTVAQDRRHAAQRLDVVDHRRQVLVAVRDRVGRLVARERVLALEALEQRGLLAADVGACAATDEDVEVEALAPADRTAEQARLTRLGQRRSRMPTVQGYS